jgi:diaminobutyrate-2-oxoglutarate transaminase
LLFLHNHEVVSKAIEKMLQEKAPLLTLHLATPIKNEFINTLFSNLPEKMAENSKIQFCSPCGTDAVEAALKLVFLFWVHIME